MHDHGLCPDGPFDRPYDVDVVDLLHPGDIVDAPDLALLDTIDDDVAEVSHIQRLPQILSITGDREYGYSPHEAGEPA